MLQLKPGARYLIKEEEEEKRGKLILIPREQKTAIVHGLDGQPVSGKQHHYPSQEKLDNIRNNLKRHEKESKERMLRYEEGRHPLDNVKGLLNRVQRNYNRYQENN